MFPWDQDSAEAKVPPPVESELAPEPGGPPAKPTGEAEAQSPALQRFLTCRWRKGAEVPVPDYCTHRDVQPMAGTAGFTPGSWCLDCGLFKVRRAPRKRPPAAPADRYYY
jgi:hypothetical protein